MKNIRTGNGADIFCLDLLSLFDYWSYFRPPFFKTGIFRPMSVHKYGWRPGGSVPNLDPNKDSETSLFIFMDVGWTGSARYLQYHTGYRKKYGKDLKFYYFCRKSVGSAVFTCFCQVLIGFGASRFVEGLSRTRDLLSAE